MTASTKRDYSITGPEKERAIARGLASANWYQCPIDRKRLKELTKRRNGPAIRDTVLWLLLMAAAGYVVWLAWGTWWVLPALIVYGVFYSVGATSRWHEFCHGTPFRTAWLNEAMYFFCAFLIVSQAINFRWSHVRHHTDTYIVGRDPEIMEERPPLWKRAYRHLNKPKEMYGAYKALFIYARGGKTGAWHQELMPEHELRKLVLEARLNLVGYAIVIAIAIVTGSVLPLLLVGLPAFFGGYAMTLLNATQHLGLYEDTTDHRLCCRTFHTNFFLRFLYSNMNYHMEHHMFPTVPYYNLPKLHEAIKDDCPAPAPSFTAALIETLSALRQEIKNPAYVVPRYRTFAEQAGADTSRYQTT